MNFFLIGCCSGIIIIIDVSIISFYMCVQIIVFKRRTHTDNKRTLTNKYRYTHTYTLDIEWKCVRELNVYILYLDCVSLFGLYFCCICTPWQKYLLPPCNMYQIELYVIYNRKYLLNLLFAKSRRVVRSWDEFNENLPL